MKTTEQLARECGYCTESETLPPINGFLEAFRRACIQDYFESAEPVALLPIGAGIPPCIKTTCGVNCVTEKEAAEYTPESIVQLFAAPKEE